MMQGSAASGQQIWAGAARRHNASSGCNDCGEGGGWTKTKCKEEEEEEKVDARGEGGGGGRGALEGWEDYLRVILHLAERLRMECSGPTSLDNKDNAQ